MARSRYNDSRSTFSFSRLLVMLVLLLAVGGGIALGLWENAPSTTTVEKVVPNDRFPQ